MLGAVAGCGGGSGGGAVRSAPAASEAPERLVSQQELDAALLSPQQFPGELVTTVEGKTSDGRQIPGTLNSGRSMPISPASCQLLNENATANSGYRQYARIDELVGDDDAGRSVTVALVAYQPGDAHKAIADLRAALPGCTSWSLGPLQPGDSYEHPRIQPDSHLGDESLEYRITERTTDDYGPPTVPWDYLLVRKGSVLVCLSAENVPGKTAVVRRDVVKAQLAKLP